MSGAIKQKVEIQSEIAFQVEVMMARNELNARLSFDRTLLTLQIQVLGAVVAVFAAITQGHLPLPPSYVEAACGVVLWISFALQCENVVNQSTIAALALFTDKVLNEKYEILQAPGHLVWDWDRFWARQHVKSLLLGYLSLSLLSASLVLNLLLSGGAIAIFWITLKHDNSRVHKLALGIAIGGLLSNSLVLVSYLKIEIIVKVKQWVERKIKPPLTETTTTSSLP